MLSFILVVVLSFIIYHRKKIKCFIDGTTDPVTTKRLGIIVLFIFFAVTCFFYLGMSISAVEFNSNVAKIHDYSDYIAQLEIELDEVNTNIEHFSSHSKLTNEEINIILEVLSSKKSDIEAKIDSINNEIDQLNFICERTKIYKFLLYFC